MNEGIWTTVIGIFGTLAGAVLGWLLNNVSRRAKLKILIAGYFEEFQSENEMGEIAGSNSFSEVEVYFYILSLDAYNSNSDNRSMGDFKVEYQNGRKLVLVDVSKNGESRRSVAGSINLYIDVPAINVPPKSMVRLLLVGGF